MTEVCIALDAMGGDHGPKVIVPAALLALSRYPNLKLILVGNASFITEQLRLKRVHKHPRLTILHATQEVEMDEPPAVALRKKTDSSMRIAIDLVKDKTAEAVVSAGNTGALMAFARYVLKTLPGIDRPAIVYSIPTTKGHTHMLDLGANVDCEGRHLVEFAVMGSVLAAAVGHNPHPRVALLNVGSEAMKGNLAVKEAASLLSSLSKDELNYIGFIEGDGIYFGEAEVVVCDGFVGNVALKSSEGIARMMLSLTEEAFKKNWYSKLAGIVAWPILQYLKKRFDPRLYNGASLLGLQGIVIKSHGNADESAFAQAIRVAMLEVEKKVVQKIQVQVTEQLAKCRLPS